jgi:selenocysteine lyase/cysteine desulfurase
MTPLDIHRLRAETPGTRSVNHLNNAGAGLMPEPVREVVVEHLDLEARIGGYEAEATRQAEIQSVYDSVGTLIGADPQNVAIAESATGAFIQALSAVPFAPGDVILTTLNDYVSNQIMFLSLASRFGIEIVRAPDQPTGGVDVRALEKLVHRRRPKLVAVTQVPTSSGLVQRAADVGAICRERGILYLVDACQSVGQMPVDVEDLGCDFLSATSRKFLRGPRGVGFLYVSDRALDRGLEPLFPDMRGADWIEADLYQPAPGARRFENFEAPVAMVLGMGRAARYALDLGLEPIRERAWALADSLRERLAGVDGVRVQDKGEERCAIVTLSAEAHHPLDLLRALRKEGINTSRTGRDSAIFDFEEKGVDQVLRVSPHYYNTEEEIVAFVDALSRLITGRA